VFTLFAEVSSPPPPEIERVLRNRNRSLISLSEKPETFVAKRADFTLS